MMNIYEPKVLHQGIDFLTIDYFCNDSDKYNIDFLSFLDKLEEYKKEAQLQEAFGVKFVKKSILKNKEKMIDFGKWFVSSKGLNRFAYYMENQDFRVFVSRAKLSGDLPQIRVEIPAKTIFRIGVKKAIKVFERFIKYLLGKNFERRVSRIDLATDIGGIMYSPKDIFRFQTRMGMSQFSEDLVIANYMRFQRFQGIQFGRGDKVFRIYDKTQKIVKSPNEAYIKEKWKFNGYDETYPVFRHEIQYRREEIKKFIPLNCDDEVYYILNSLGNLWFRAINLVEFVPLNEDEISRIFDNPLIKSDTKRKIFYRAKKDEKRFQFWDILRNWENQRFVPIEIYKKVKVVSVENVKRQFKAFFGSLFKYSGGDLTEFKSIIEEVQNDLLKNGSDLISYGLFKIATSFVDNYEAIMLSDEVIPEREYLKVVNLYDEFQKALKKVNNKDYERIFRKVVNYV